MPYIIAKIPIPHNGFVYLFFDPLDGKFATSMTENCPPDGAFECKLSDAFKRVDSSVK